jgi:O-antigen/teichoic acid export membrane protein
MYFKRIYLKHKEIIINFVWRSLQIFGKQGITFLIFLLCAKLLNPYDFGIYNYILAILFFLIMFGDFGISTATSKYVTEYNITDKEKLKMIIFNSGIIILVLTLVVSLITIFIAPWYLKDKYIYALYLLPLIFLAPMTSLYDGVYRGLKKFKNLAIISLIVGVLSLGFIYFLIKDYGLMGALISQNLFYLLLFLALAFGHKGSTFKINKNIMLVIGKYALLVGLANLGYFFYTKIDLVILGKFNYIIETGYYGLISTFFGLSLMFFSILGNVIAPDNIQLKINNNIQKIKKRIKFFIIVIPIIGIVISLVLYFVIPIIIKIFLPSYDNASFYSIFYIFLFVIPLAVLETVLASGFITPLGHINILTKTILFGGFLNVLFDFIFLHYFGFIGIIIASVIVQNFINSLKIFLFWKKIYQLR